jgi:hypothetical protein
MRVALILAVLIACFVYLSISRDMIVGDTVHKKMVFHQRMKDFAIPFKKRVKSLTYTDPERRIIKVVSPMFTTE